MQRVAFFALPATLTIAGLLGFAVTLTAQSVPEPYAQPAPATVKADKPPAAEISLTYQATNFEHSVTDNRFWLKGGGALQFSGRAYKGLRIAVDVFGGRTSNRTDNANSINLVTYVFGPQYAFHPRGSRLTFFGEVLGGEARAFNTQFTGNNRSQTSASSVAVLAGGGVDFRLTEHFAVRPVQVDYLHTQLPTLSGNSQENLRIGGGLVVRFGTR